ncbi:hypothetical protein HON22_00415, partial [Candidatus Peregrinibacteria bacterium]|nr:hypothetical protein [Candidatus Peregrinibacteria bacterium]
MSIHIPFQKEIAPISPKALIKSIGAFSTIAILSGCAKEHRISPSDPFESIYKTQAYESTINGNLDPKKKYCEIVGQSQEVCEEKHTRPSDMDIFLSLDSAARNASGSDKEKHIYKYLDSGLNLINNSCRDWFKKSIVHRTKTSMAKENTTSGFNLASALAGIAKANPLVGTGLATIESAVSSTFETYLDGLQLVSDEALQQVYDLIVKQMRLHAEEIRAYPGITYNEARDQLIVYNNLCSAIRIRNLITVALKNLQVEGENKEQVQQRTEQKKSLSESLYSDFYTGQNGKFPDNQLFGIYMVFSALKNKSWASLSASQVEIINNYIDKDSIKYLQNEYKKLAGTPASTKKASIIMTSISTIPSLMGFEKNSDA